MIFYLYLIAVYIPTNTIAEPVISIKLAPIPNKIHCKKKKSSQKEQSQKEQSSAKKKEPKRTEPKKQRQQKLENSKLLASMFILILINQITQSKRY